MISGFPGPLIFISAGEVSGDLYGAGLLQALKQQVPSLQAYGLGGPQLQAAGLKLLADVRHLAAVGLTENAGSVAFFWRLKQCSHFLHSWCLRSGLHCRRDCPCRLRKRWASKR